jgi:hypothetical protein
MALLFSASLLSSSVMVKKYCRVGASTTLVEFGRLFLKGAFAKTSEFYDDAKGHDY